MKPRLISAPVAARYLGGERPERFGVKPLTGKRQRLYDLKAIDAALDAWSRIESCSFADDPAAALAEEWR